MNKHATRDYKDMINEYLKDGGKVTQCPTVHAATKIGISSGVPLHDTKGVILC